MKLTEQDIKNIARREARSTTRSYAASYGGGGVSESWVDDNFVSKEFFNRLFTIHSADSVITPNDTGTAIASIEAMAGFWTESFVSALGQGSGGGGGGGASALSDLVDVSLGTLANGNLLCYDSSQSKWVNIAQSSITPDLTGYATQTWVQSQGYLTSHQSLSGYATESWVQSQGYLTSHQSLSGYATETWVQQQGYLTTHQIVSGTFWGRSWSNGGTVSGNIYAGSSGGSILQFHSIELNSAGSLENYGGFIDFHFDGSSSDYTSRIIEEVSGILSLIGSGVVVGNNTNGDYLQVGRIRLMYDSTNNALKVIKKDGTAANFYATGGVSALGMSAGVSSIDAMTFGNLTVSEQLNLNCDMVVGAGKRIMFKNTDDSLMSAITVDSGNNLVLGEAWTPSGYNTYVRGNYVFIQTGTSYTTRMTINANGYTTFSGYVQSSRFYLDASRYLYLSGSSLMYYNGTTSKAVAFSN